MEGKSKPEGHGEIRINVYERYGVREEICLVKEGTRTSTAQIFCEDMS